MSSQGKKNAAKGGLAEEVLAAYFRQVGYFVVRGVPFEYEGYSVTDIDLWLYVRSSSVSREIAIVDIKRKRTPQAIERIFWTKGLQKAVRADRAIVATTDSREEVVSFGKQLGVTVLGGKFLKKLEKPNRSEEARLSEEDLSKIFDENPLGKLDGDWKGRLARAKQGLAHGLSFDQINFWLEDARFFSEQVIARPGNRDIAMRCMFRVASFVAIGIDYILKDLSFEDGNEKRRALKAGFTYGDGGANSISDSVGQSLTLLQQFGGVSSSDTGAIKARVEAAFSDLPTEILSEFFGNVSVARGLVSTAKELDSAGMYAGELRALKLSQPTVAFIGCLLDFWGLDRTKFGLGLLYKSSEQSAGAT